MFGSNERMGFKKAIIVTEAPSVRRATEVICQFYLRFYAQSIYLKGCQESVSYTSVALCAIGTSLTLHSSLSTPCLCVPYYVRV